jgi:hypothetical protein
MRLGMSHGYGQPGRSGTTTGVSGPKRTEDQRTLDRIETVRLMRRGWTRTAIAERHGVHPSTISWDFKAILRELNESRDRDIDELVAVKLEELGELKREAWSAWERSKLDHKKVMTESGPCGSDDEEEEEAGSSSSGNGRKGRGRKRRKKASGRLAPSKLIETLQGQSGDPRYLRTVLDCLHAECELQSLYPAKAITGRIAVLNWDELAQRIPSDGPGAGTPGSANSVVPDIIEEMIARALGYDPKEAIQRIEMDRPSIESVEEVLKRQRQSEERIDPASPDEKVQP